SILIIIFFIVEESVCREYQTVRFEVIFFFVIFLIFAFLLFQNIEFFLCRFDIGFDLFQLLFSLLALLPLVSSFVITEKQFIQQRFLFLIFDYHFQVFQCFRKIVFFLIETVYPLIRFIDLLENIVSVFELFKLVFKIYQPVDFLFNFVFAIVERFDLLLPVYISFNCLEFIGYFIYPEFFFSIK